MSALDVIRLLAVPILGWAAWKDYRVRRIPGWIWYPLYIAGIVLILIEGSTIPTSQRRLYLLRVAISLAFIGPLAWGFWYFGLFGAADRKAFIAIALLFPTFPSFQIAGLSLPVVETTLGVFSLTILTNGVILGIVYPNVTALQNAIRGQFSPVMFLARPISWESVLQTHGKLFETPEGFTLNGLDLDALRMYLRWRDLDLADIRERPDQLRDPSSLPKTPNPPTDGAVDTTVRSDGGYSDPWGAAAFLDSVGSAYGTTPTQLRDGLDLIVTEDEVWVSPGIPFLVPVFAGLVVSLLVGDILFMALQHAGFV